jgi:hypothetical protein
MPLGADRVADGAGIVTLVIGTGLTVAPVRTAGILGLGHRPALARALGLTDLVVGPRLLFSRPRWPRMAVRAALNLLIAAIYGRDARGASNRRRALLGAVAMTLVTVVDGAAAMSLRRSERGRGAIPGM